LEEIFSIFHWDATAVLLLSGFLDHDKGLHRLLEGFAQEQVISEAGLGMYPWAISWKKFSGVLSDHNTLKSRAWIIADQVVKSNTALTFTLEGTELWKASQYFCIKAKLGTASLLAGLAQNKGVERGCGVGHPRERTHDSGCSVDRCAKERIRKIWT
jgi:hypothetical protein